ncbi:hypothetical protein BJX64DRAFT_272447 [Aspergillus heterothallicus]
MGNWKIRQRIPSDKEFTEADRRVNDLNSSVKPQGRLPTTRNGRRAISPNGTSSISS